MTSRTVFKIFGSLGPGGSIVSIMEKLCKRLFREAYDLGNPDQFQSAEEDSLKVVRKDFITELFNFKGSFERESESVNGVVKIQCYKKLKELVIKHKTKITHVERQRLTKERVFYLREQDIVKYNESIESLKFLKEDIDDNVDKMVKSLFPAMEWALFTDAAEPTHDQEASTIGERVSEADAKKYHAYWIELQTNATHRHHEEGADGEKNTALLNRDIELKDQLFIQFGQDVDDIFMSFNHYGLQV
jgi:hypothetical protein